MTTFIHERTSTLFTAEQIRNLDILATYLDTKVNPAFFHMKEYAQVPLVDDDDGYTLMGMGDIEDELDRNGMFYYQEGQCGSSACAIGWATNAVEKKNVDESWEKYARRLFGVDAFGVTDNDTSWTSPGTSLRQIGCWLFGAEEGVSDPKKTAERIRYVLSHGEIA